MSSIIKHQSKNGTFYEIFVSRGRKQPRATTRWYPPAEWSQRAIERELTKVAAEYERAIKAGELTTLKEQKARDEAAAAAAARILTVRKYGELYLKQKASNIAESTRDGYQRMFDNWIYPAIGDKRITDVTPDDIDSLLQNLKDSGKAHTSCVKCYVVLAGLFKRAYKKDVISTNPMDKVDRPKPRKGELISDEPDSCTAEEARYILQCLEKEPLFWRAYVQLLIDTGCRRGEITALTWTAIDFKSSQISIISNVCYTPAAGQYLDTPKNRRKRTVDIGPETVALLKQLRHDQVEHGISKYVFAKKGNPSEPMFATAPTRYLASFSKRYGIHIYPHKLRHTYASLAITNGADIASVSENLGHADTSVTLKVYTDANAESRKRASDLVRDAINKAM